MLFRSGQISYGLYLFHNFVPAGTVRVARALWHTTPDQLLGAGAVYVFNGAVLVALAALSWHLVEQPLNRLKRYVPYVVGVGARRGAGDAGRGSVGGDAIRPRLWSAAGSPVTADRD